MENKYTWIENEIVGFNSFGVYSKYVETDNNALLEEATYSPVILEVEDLQLLKGYISTGVWRIEGNSSNSWLWYLLVPRGNSQVDGWFPLPLLWEESSLSPHLASIKERLEMLMAEV